MNTATLSPASAAPAAAGVPAAPAVHPPLVSWALRSVHADAQDFDRTEGAMKLARLLHADAPLAALGTEGIALMATWFDFVRVEAGREVISQDELGDYMLLVLEGTLAVDRVQPWGGRARLAEAGPGDLLGEMSLLDEGARFSACVTLTPCVLAVISTPQLHQMMDEEPRLALALVTSLSRRMSLRLRQVSSRLSALLSRG